VPTPSTPASTGAASSAQKTHPGSFQLLRGERQRKMSGHLELSRTILENLPMPIIGIGADGLIVMMNRKAESLSEKWGGLCDG